MEVHNTRWRHAVDEIGFVASARTTGNSRKYPKGGHLKIINMQRQILGERTLS